MIRKSVQRFSEKIMLKQRAKRDEVHPDLIALSRSGLSHCG